MFIHVTSYLDSVCHNALHLPHKSRDAVFSRQHSPLTPPCGNSVAGSAALPVTTRCSVPVKSYQTFPLSCMYVCKYKDNTKVFMLITAQYSMDHRCSFNMFCTKHISHNDLR